MYNYWNSRTRGLSPYVPGEQPGDKKYIKLNTNENPYPPSPKVIEAIRNAAGERLRLYPDPTCQELREAIAQTYRVKPEQVFTGNGSDEVLAFVFAGFFGPDPAYPLLFPDITYSFYPVYGNLWNIPFRAVPVTEDFSINPKDYQTSSGGIIFPNPNAPTGKALPFQAIQEILICQEKQGRIVVIDEAYAAFGGESAVPHIMEHPNLLTIHTLSKSASLAGLRVGFAIGNEALIEGLCRIRDSFNSYTLDRLALAGAVAAVLDVSYYREINRKVIVTRERVTKALTQDLDFDVLPSEANFIFIRSSRQRGAELFAALREQGILVRHFNKPRTADFLRVSIGTDEEMDIFLNVLGKGAMKLTLKS
ncbi:MAG: histidinol-phosphate transaminase [Treponema sp.]|jgi:histidinol-phosphate aminotransferase|nr:histidinol-phosphate transaminase [Treponema sp.]